MTRCALTLAVALACSAANADVYKCQQNGKMVFSDQPCGGSAEKINVKPASGYADAVSEADAVAASKAFIDKTNASAKRNALDADIERAQDRINSLQNDRDRELAALREKKQRANNNLAGAVWEQSISNEMIAVNETYSSKISAAERTLANLRAKRAALN